MCSLGFARSLGFTLIPLATCCIVTNVLLFIPDGQVTFVQKNLLTTCLYFMGIGGGGVAMLIPATVFLGMGKCANTCGTESCAMCGSVIAALVGIAGSGYCFMISVVALLKGQYCFTRLGWRYLFTRERWSDCIQPEHIVEWNVTLLSILLV